MQFLRVWESLILVEFPEKAQNMARFNDAVWLAH
jgi:hypothetical protein